VDRSVTVLVLKKTKLGETDLIITGFSDEGLQIRAVAKGARKPGSRLGAHLELYSIARILLYEGSGLGIIREATTVASNEACRSDVLHSAGAAVIVELIEVISSEGNHEARLFPLAKEALRCLGQAPDCAVALLAAAASLKIVAQIGYRPSLGECVLCGEIIEISSNIPAKLSPGIPDGNPDRFSDGIHGGASNKPPREADVICFSFDDGGAICDNCVNMLEEQSPKTVDARLAQWTETLISSRFIDLEHFTGEDYSELGNAMLKFTREWIAFHIVKRLKSLDFLLNFR